jgi:hypothetical protein
VATATSISGPARPGRVDLIASCVTLYSVAVTLPLFDLLGRSPEFFVAHRVGGADVVAVALVVAVVVPLLLGGLVVLADRIDHRAGRVAHAVVLGLLGGTIAVVALKASPLDGLPWWGYGAIAVAAGAGVVYAYHRFANLRWVLRIGVVVPLVAVGLFLLGSRTSALVLPSEPPAAAAVGFPADAPPIVMLVFDELPLASLIDGEGHIQEGPYPNLARLAAEGTWYRDATTVASHTTYAVPALVTGTTAAAGSLPTYTDHPDNLFSWAAGGYDLRVVEPVTDLCPKEWCGDPIGDRMPSGQRWRLLWSDLRVVAGHVFLPDGVAARLLPPIDQNWTGFDLRDRFGDAVDGDRRTHVAAFLDLIEPAGERPPLYFGHFMLPHTPWAYLPDGRAYQPYLMVENSFVDPGWSEDRWAVTQSQQRHLAQVQYVDAIVGQVMARLEEAGIYDQAVVVVTADHGIGVRPGLGNRRRLVEGTIPDIAAVPLIVKAPGQDAGVVDDYPAMVTDVVPTIAALVGADLDWEAEGIPLTEPDRPARPTRTYIPVSGSTTPVVYPSPFADVTALAARRIRAFGPDGAFGLAPRGQAGLLGDQVSGLDAAAADDRWVATVLNAADYVDVDAAGDGLPAVTRIRLSGPDAEAGEVVAVALNGTVTAVSVTYTVEGDEAHYLMVMMNPAHFVDGANRIELFHVTGAGPERAVQQIAVG